MSSDISKAIQFLCDEKDLSYDIVLKALESALAAAYRKDFGNRHGNYKVKFDPDTGDMNVWDVKEVSEDIAEEVLEKAQEELAVRREKAKEEGRELTEEETADLPHFNPKTQIMMTAAKEIKPAAKVGEILDIEQEIPADFGRMAAQTAKQVIIQKLREAERNTVFADFKGQEGQIVQGTVQRRDRSGSIIIDLGKITGILPANEQISRDHYRPGVRLRFYIVSVSLGVRGPEIILSRSHKNMVQSVFEKEIPEVGNGDVVIKSIARDPGNRSKVAVFTNDEGIDPIGACIGQRGSRINTIIEELGGEKIDVIHYNASPTEFIKHALAPAKVSAVELNESVGEAIAKVASDQFSLAIGRGGQNVRLAAGLTGWKIKVVEEGNEDAVVSSDDEIEEVAKKLVEGTTDTVVEPVEEVLNSSETENEKRD